MTHRQDSDVSGCSAHEDSKKIGYVMLPSVIHVTCSQEILED